MDENGLHSVLEEVDEEIVLVFEIQVDRAPSDPRRLGDVADPCVKKPSLCEDFYRSVEDPSTFVGFLGPRTGDRKLLNESSFIIGRLF